MDDIHLELEPATAERFAPYGDLIHAPDRVTAAMNDGRFDRFGDLARIDIDGSLAVGIVRSRTATTLPYRVDRVERHPLGSQAFVPLARFAFAVVVAPIGEAVAAEDLRAFWIAPGYGVNYLRGIWHMPLIALQDHQEFLVIDRGGPEPNCEEWLLSESVMLLDSRGT